jgi:hypothetical protein
MNLLVKAHNRKVHLTRCKDGDFVLDIVRLSSIDDDSNPVESERYTTRDKKKMIRVTSMKLSKRTVEMLMHGILEFERKEQKENYER